MFRYGFVFIVAVISNIVLAQQEDDFKASFDDFVQGQRTSFDTFIEQRDREFLQMLTEQWQEFEQMPALQRDDKPKPKDIPRATPEHEEAGVAKSAQRKLSDPINNVTPASPVNSPADKILLFYGHQLSVPAISPPMIQAVTSKMLANFWQQILTVDHQPALSSLLQHKQQLVLSDWAYWLLVQQYSHLHAGDVSQARALAWFLLNKSGYQVKVGVSGEELVLLLPAAQTIYAKSYYTIAGERFYQLTESDTSNIKTYNGEYDPAHTILNLSFDKTLKTKPQLQYRELKYTVNDAPVRLSIPYDYHRVRFFKDYPQLDLKYYFGAPLSAVSANAFSEQLTPLLQEGKSDNLNQLLRFIHQAFPYAVDEEQFGEENYLLIEETLHYQASDCEDRSVLFAWLARNLLRESVVAMDYPGHVSTAIVRDNKLLSADPTYIGAVLGDVMPQYKNIKPAIVHF